jgi:hypothetical protein
VACTKRHMNLLAVLHVRGKQLLQTIMRQLGHTELTAVTAERERAVTLN